MTVAKYRVHTTAAQRLQQREEFKALKARVAAAPSAKTVAYKARNLGNAERTRARAKIKDALAGAAVRPFSTHEIGKVKPDELSQLWHEAEIRLHRLSPEQRQVFNRYWWLMLLSMTDDQVAALAKLP